jgi:hypothetical protein
MVKKESVTSSKEFSAFGFKVTIGEPTETQPENEFFAHGEERDLLRIGRDLARYLFKQNVNKIVFLDTGARPASVCLREAWKRLYPHKSCPEIYFMNPRGFHTQDTVEQTATFNGRPVSRYAVMALKDLGDKPQPMIIRFFRFRKRIGQILKAARQNSDELIREEFENIFSKLAKDIDQPIMVFDTCSHTGVSMEAVVGALETIGFDDVRVGLVTDERNYSSIKPDLAIFHGTPRGLCYPFGRDSMVEKTMDSLVSTKSQKKKDRMRGIRLRKTIKDVFESQWR